MCFDDAHDPYVEKARITGAVMVGTGLVAALAGSILLLVSSREQRPLGRWRGRATGILSGGAVAFAALGLGVVTFASIIEWAECNSG
jgi:hypothetical protein